MVSNVLSIPIVKFWHTIPSKWASFENIWLCSVLQIEGCITLQFPTTPTLYPIITCDTYINGLK